MDISFLLPSNRPFSEFAGRVIDNINTLDYKGKTFEVILVHPEEPDGYYTPNTKWVKDPGTNGCVEAYNIAYNESIGDHVFESNIPDVIHEFDKAQFADREYEVICLATNHHGPCALPARSECAGLIARYPVFSRNTIDTHLGGIIYNPKFRHHYPDNWLGFWLHTQGEPVIESPAYNVITFRNECYSHNDSHDENAFYDMVKDYNQGNTKYDR